MRFLTSFLLFVLIAFPVTNAISDTEIEKLCKETTDAAYCVNVFRTDPRTPAAGDLSGVLLIAISNAKMRVDDGTTHIGTISRRYNGPHGKRRIEICKNEYKTASDMFFNAWDQAQKKRLTAARHLAVIATNDVIKCENEWKKGGPVQASPLTEYTRNVSTLGRIIDLIIQKLM